MRPSLPALPIIPFLALSLAGTVPALAAPAAAAGLTVISFGRADQDALSKAFYGPFSQASGIAINSLTYDGQLGELEQMVHAGQAVWDLVQMESRSLRQGCEQGLFERIDRSRVAAVGQLIPGALSECGVGIFAWSMALVYTDRVKPAPRSWADVWDLEKYPGKRGLRRSAKYTLEIALLADGVPPAEVYTLLATEAGQDRAFRKLEKIKAHTLWWEAAAQPGTSMAAGDIAMSSAYTLWFDPEQARNRHYRIAWNRSLYDVDSWAIPKGSPKRDQAYRFIEFASEAVHQKALAELLPYGPANRKALELLKKPLAQSLPSSPAVLASALKVDTAFWIEHGEALEKRFDQWAPPICRQQTDDDEDDSEDPPQCQDMHGRLRVREPAHGEKPATPPWHAD